MRTAPARLGELVEKRGQITREQLLRALRNQKVLGGRLGTCLLEIEALSEEQLCSALAEQFAMPCATPEDLRGIPDDVLEMLPAKVARRCHAIAFRASSTQVKVALIDARNLAYQDEISFVVGKRILWHVAPELRLMEALEKHYGVECPSRYAKLLDKMNRSRFLWARESSAGKEGTAARQPADQLHWDTKIAGVAAAPPADSPSSVSVELPHFQHQTLELPTLAPAAAATTAVAPAATAPLTPAPPTAPAAVPATAPPAAPPVAPSPPAGAAKAAKATRPPKPLPAPPSPPSPISGTAVATPAEPSRPTVDEIEQRLLQPRQRDDVARALIDFAAGLLQRAVLFVVRKEEISAWLWSGPGLDVERLAALRLSLQQPSFFDGLQEKDASFSGRLAPLPSHLALGACFTAPPLAKEVVALPVKVRDRLVAALFFEPRSAAGAGLAPSDLADLQRVIAKAEIAFEVCIMQSKLRKA